MNIIYSVPFLIMWCSVCEWLLHKYIMHRAFFGFQYPYQAHTKVHHNIFKANETYHCKREKDKKTIPMAKWNGVVISTLVGLPMLIFGLKMFILTFSIAMCYYFIYEYLHWCMHLPKKRKLEYGSLFRFLNGHHLLHHRYMNKNYNVVLPFADLIFLTLLKKSPVKFKQPRESYCVPNVQSS